LQAVVAALREREAALLTVQSIEDDLDKRRRAAAALEEAGSRRWGAPSAEQAAAARSPRAFCPTVPADVLFWAAATPRDRVGGDAAKARKVAAMQNEVSALEAALTAAQQEYERVKRRNLEVRCGQGHRARYAGRCRLSWAERHAPEQAAPWDPSCSHVQELDRTRQERAASYAQLAAGYATVESLYNERCLEIWRAVAEDFGAAGQLEAQQRARDNP
jgi:hypothetical protein